MNELNEIARPDSAEKPQCSVSIVKVRRIIKPRIKFIRISVLFRLLIVSLIFVNFETKPAARNSGARIFVFSGKVFSNKTRKTRFSCGYCDGIAQLPKNLAAVLEASREKFGG